MKSTVRKCIFGWMDGWCDGRFECQRNDWKPHDGEHIRVEALVKE